MPPKSRPLNRNTEQVKAILAGATQFRVPVKFAKVGSWWLEDLKKSTISSERQRLV